MEAKRKPLQGIINIIRFNWHYYATAILVIFSLLFFNDLLFKPFQPFVFYILLLAALTISISLIVSFYIYDISDLYKLRWLSIDGNKTILNVNAGFDETSEIIKQKFLTSNLTICDFYDAKKHTEISIKRARKAYPPIDKTIQVSTNKLPFLDNSFDFSLAILSAHEIRNEQERIDFFKELNRVTKSTGQIHVTEHLRDLNNFLAYTIGCFHFHSKLSWLNTFKNSQLKVKQEVKSTPFITTFILEKNGDAL